MNKDFPRIITFLRKERGITQKQAAADLEISQAVLSHYEKGVRECGLDFLVKAAEYYEVSTDYLLREAEAASPAAPIKEAPIPEPSASQPITPIVQVLPPQQKKNTPPTILVIGSVLLVLGILVWLTLLILSAIHPCTFYQGQDYWDGLQGYIRTYKLQDLYHASLAAIVIGLVTDITYGVLQRSADRRASNQ